MPKLGNTYALKWTIEEAEKACVQILDILDKDKEICLESELKLAVYKHMDISPSSYVYILYNKFKQELSDYAEVIRVTLEGRTAKTKSMYPGIAAMALKNKHQWKDKQEIEAKVDGELNVFSGIVEASKNG